MEDDFFRMRFSPPLIPFLLRPSKSYIKTTSGGSVAPFSVQIGPETTKNVVPQY